PPTAGRDSITSSTTSIPMLLCFDAFNGLRAPPPEICLGAVSVALRRLRLPGCGADARVCSVGIRADVLKKCSQSTTVGTNVGAADMNVHATSAVYKAGSM